MIEEELPTSALQAQSNILDGATTDAWDSKACAVGDKSP